MANVNLGKVALTPKGNWDNTITYEKLDIVQYDGNSYIAKTGVPIGISVTTGTEYWQLFSAKGNGISVGDVIIASTTQPTVFENKLWIREGNDEEYEVLTTEDIDDTAGIDDVDKVWSADKLDKKFIAVHQVSIDRADFINIKNNLFFISNHYLSLNIANTTTLYSVYDESMQISMLTENTNSLYIDFDYDVLVHPEEYPDSEKGIRVYFRDSDNNAISNIDIKFAKSLIYVPDGTVYITVGVLLSSAERISYNYTEQIRINKLQVYEIAEIDENLLSKFFQKTKVIEFDYTSPIRSSAGSGIVVRSPIPVKPETTYVAKFDSMTSNQTYNFLYFRLNEYTNDSTVIARNVLTASPTGDRIVFKTNALTKRISFQIYYSSDLNDNIFSISGFKLYEYSDKYEYILSEKVQVKESIGPNVLQSGEVNSFGSNNSLFIKSLLPSYWTSDNYLEGIRDKIRDIRADARFTFITDCHYCFNPSRNSVKLMQYFNDMFHIHHTIDGGDIIGDQWSTTTHASAITKLNYWADELLDVMYENYHYAYGNHDQNRANPREMTSEEQLACALTYEDVYKALVAPFKRSKVFENTNLSENDDLYYWNRMHYYVDDPIQKMRYIIMNTGTPRDTLYNNVYTGNNEIYIQLNWLYDTLMSTPDGYSVIIFGHQFFTGYFYLQEENLPPNPDFTVYTPVVPIARMMIGAKNKLLIDTGGNSSYYEKGDVKEQYDFSKAPDIIPICLWCGHHHIDANWVYNMDDDSMTYSPDCPHGADDNKILMICTTSDTKNGTSTYKDYLPARSVGDRTEHAFDIVSINKDERTIYATRVGYGNDRTFTY